MRGMFGLDEISHGEKSPVAEHDEGEESRDPADPARKVHSHFAKRHVMREAKRVSALDLNEANGV